MARAKYSELSDYDAEGRKIIEKSAASVVDIPFDWSEWITDVSDTISSYSVSESGSMTIDSHSRTGNVITVWVSGGDSGSRGLVTCTITTAAGRIESITAVVMIGTH